MIPGVTYHPRESWEDPNLPIYDPPAYTPPLHDLSLIDLLVYHYTAAVNLPDGDLGEFEYNIPPYLRAIQRDYRLSIDPVTGKLRRGYSFGYSWVVDWLGGVWEGRGWEYRTAATGGKKVGGGVNPRSFAILCLVDGSDPLTAEAVESVRKIHAEVNRRTGRTVSAGPHSHFDWTGCCGDGIRAQIAGGLLLPRPTQPDLPPEDDMANIALVRPRGIADAFTLNPETTETLRRKGMLGQPAVVVDVDVADLEAQLGYKLTKTTNGQ